MNSQQFKFWVDGFLADKTNLTEEQILVIKNQSKNVFDYMTWSTSQGSVNIQSTGTSSYTGTYIK